ncbi:ATP-binding protein [Streptomyces sp. NPDC018693]|uniref:ATP-binding protein n=1 Tax=unclassified Streptomyces TaxID=2593676 RepID=UPI0037B8193B
MTVDPSAPPTGHLSYAQTLPCEKASVLAARRLVRRALAALDLENLTEDSSLIVSELATNAVQHARSRHMHVTVSRPTPEWVRVSVTDKSRTMPDPRAASDGDTGGRGLAVVDSLSDRWGTDRLPWGKRVWAEWRTDVKR